MKMTLAQALEAIARGETPEQYAKRLRRIRRLANERDDLMDWISVFDDSPEDAPIVKKKRDRLDRVLAMIEELK